MPEKDRTERLGKVSKNIAAGLMIITDAQEIVVFSEPDQNSLRTIEINGHLLDYRTKILGSMDGMMIPQKQHHVNGAIAEVENACLPDIEVGHRMVMVFWFSQSHCVMLFMNRPVGSITVKK